MRTHRRDLFTLVFIKELKESIIRYIFIKENLYVLGQITQIYIYKLIFSIYHDSF